MTLENQEKRERSGQMMEERKVAAKTDRLANLSLPSQHTHTHRYASIADLLFQNSDHLIDTLVTHLMHLQLYPETTRVFKAIVRIMTEVDAKDKSNSNGDGGDRADGVETGPGAGRQLFWFLGLIREPFEVFLATFFCGNKHRFTTNEESEILSQVAEISLAAARSRLHRNLHDDDTLAFLEATCEKCALVQVRKVLYSLSLSLSLSLLSLSLSLSLLSPLSL